MLDSVVVVVVGPSRPAMTTMHMTLATLPLSARCRRCTHSSPALACTHARQKSGAWSWLGLVINPTAAAFLMLLQALAGSWIPETLSCTTRTFYLLNLPMSCTDNKLCLKPTRSILALIVNFHTSSGGLNHLFRRIIFSILVSYPW